MNLPNKRQRFTEEELKIIQEFYKRAPSMPSIPQYNYYANQSVIPAFPLTNQVPERKAQPSPDCLKNYITRAFSKCTSDTERDLMEKLIKDVIADKKNSGMFFSQDWDKTDLPLLPREQMVVPPLAPPKVLAPNSNDQIQKRKTRFEVLEIEQDYKPKIKENKSDSLPTEWKIVGVCKDLEKPFFRLTSKPDPNSIRPEPVLKKAMAWFKDRWKKGEINYEYFSEQLRSIRQDLTVQGIHNKFSVETYQVHVRLALEAQDLDQYNSCMSRLFELYKEGVPGKLPVTAYIGV
jgi:SAC3/GANP family